VRGTESLSRASITRARRMIGPFNEASWDVDKQRGRERIEKRGMQN